jgi:hypothetical protein
MDELFDIFNDPYILQGLTLLVLGMLLIRLGERK